MIYGNLVKVVKVTDSIYRYEACLEGDTYTVVGYSDNKFGWLDLNMTNTYIGKFVYQYMLCILGGLKRKSKEYFE